MSTFLFILGFFPKEALLYQLTKANFPHQKMPLCSLEQFLAEQLSGSTFKVLLDVMFLYSRNALKVAFLDGGSWFFFTSHKSASMGKKPKINKDYSIYRFLLPAIVERENFRAIRAKFRAILCLVSTLVIIKKFQVDRHSGASTTS